MADLNKVMLIGRLTRDPELRYTPKGTAVCDLGLAVNDRIKSSGGDSKDKVCFLNVTTWGRQAETCAEYLKKGTPVYVEGRLDFSIWKTKDGGKRSKVGVTAKVVQFLSYKKNVSREELQEDVKV